ncbi:MAG TPA: flippase [Solirubrobacteraceae bacterium]|nr:flippase [Solirubrobacteraceae bacterium]
MSAHATSVSSRRTAFDIAVQIAAQLLNLVLGIVVTVLIVRTLGTVRYGQWATLLAITQLVGTIGSLGLEDVAVRFAAAEPEREDAWLGATVTLRAALTVPVVVLYVIAVLIISVDATMALTGLILTLLYVSALFTTLRIVFRLRVRNDIAMAFVLANSALWAGAVIAISAAGGGMIAFALAFVLLSLLMQGLLAFIAVRGVPVRWRGSRVLWGRLARVGLIVGIGGTLTFAYGRIDQLLVFELAPSASEPGLYASVYKILETAGFVPIAAMTTLFPIMSGLYPSDMRRLRSLTQLSIDYLTIASAGALAFTIVASDKIVALLYGPSFHAAASALPVLMAAFVPICIGYVGGHLVLATGLQRRYLRFATLGLALNVALNLALIPTYGFQAAAWVTLATELVVVSLTLAMVLGRIEMRLAVRKLALASLAAAIAAAAVWWLAREGAGIGVLLAAMAALYAGLLIVLRAVDVGELRTLVTGRSEPARVSK